MAKQQIQCTICGHVDDQDQIRNVNVCGALCAADARKYGMTHDACSSCIEGLLSVGMIISSIEWNWPEQKEAYFQLVPLYSLRKAAS